MVDDARRFDLNRVSRWFAAAVLLIEVAWIVPLALTSTGSVAGAATLPVCSASQLSISVGLGGGAAGNLGFPVIITNHGANSCSLDGFAIVTAHTDAMSPRPVTFVHTSRSQIYATAKAKRVVIAPGATASFGVSYVDALDQQYGEAARCVMDSITVRLPGVAPLTDATITFATHKRTYEGHINSCWAGFKFGLTPIVKGVRPPHI